MSKKQQSIILNDRGNSYYNDGDMQNALSYYKSGNRN